MLGVGVGDAKRLTYWEYSSLRHVWNDRHTLDDEADSAIEAPSLEFVLARQAELERLGISGKVH